MEQYSPMTSTARGEAIVFGGRIRARAGNGIVGAKVEILRRSTRNVLASSISIEGGCYRIRLLRESIDSQERALTIRALSGGGKLLVARSTPVPVDESIFVTDLVVPPERLKNFRPAAKILRRLKGSIIDPEFVANIESAIRLIVPEGEAEYERLTRVSRTVVPPLARFDSVLQDSWDVLEGDLDAAQRLRRALTFLANVARDHSARISAPQSARHEGEFVMRDLAYRAMPATPVPDIDEIPLRPPVCPMPTDRLVPIMAATLRIASDADDGAVLMDGLEAGLGGLSSFESLTGLAGRTLSTGDTAPLRDELTRLGIESGLDTSPGPGNGSDWPFPTPEPSPPQTLEPCGRWRRECFRNLAEDWRLQGGIRGPRLGPVYRITSVTPSDACPGDTVTIAGIGFGSIPGQVSFPHQDGDSSITVDPVAGTWTDTSVSAVVPAEAGSGTIRLVIQEGLVWTCEGPLPVYGQGTGIAFGGGATYVSSVTINGSSAGAVIAPGAQFTVAWKASPGSRTVLIVVNETSTNRILFGDLMPASGTMMLAAPAPPSLTSRGQIRASVFARPPDMDRPTCGEGHNRQAVADIDVATKSLKIEGVEITQGIQVFSLQGARNTLTTIENKDTIVRVYVAVDTGSSFRSTVTDITGALSVGGTWLFPINGITPDNPQGGNPFITARAAVDIDRKQTNHTLNFRIPAALANGVWTLRILVWGPGRLATRLSASESMSWPWQPKVPLQLRFVRVQDDRPAPGGGSGTLPTEAQARYTLQRAFDLLPSPSTNIAPAWHDIHVFTQGDPGTLVAELTTVRRAPDPATGTPDPSGWMGLIHPWIGGLAVGTVATAPTYENRDRQGGFRICAAHEITHWRAGGCHTDGQAQACAGHSGSIEIPEVVFDPYWNEAVFPALSYFEGIVNFAERHWIPPAVWNFLRGVL